MSTDLLQTPRPVGGFRTILADPPWGFTGYDGKDSVFTNAKEQPYATMTMAALKRLPVGMMAARDAVLVMWVLDAVLPQALELGAAWGFAYKTRGFTWDKGRMAGGFWVRKESEISLLFTKGRPSPASRGVRDMLRERPRQHSRKPDEVYARLERLHGGPYLELFGRAQRAGWTVWGNEVGKFGEHGAQVDHVTLAAAGQRVEPGLPEGGGVGFGGLDMGQEAGGGEHGAKVGPGG